MTDDRDLTALLRDGMAAEARPVTADQAFIAETIALATRPAPAFSPRPPAWRAWIVPAVAAAIVALLIGSVFLGGKLLHSEQRQPASHQTPVPTAPVPSHSVGKPPASKSTAAPSVTSNAPAPVVPPSGGAVPAGFRAVDLTWTSTTEGFALGTAPCQTAPCTSIVRTSDGGQTWVGLPAPKAELTEDPAQSTKCASNCVTSLRFASPLIGYAFGEQTMYLTTDGGAHWIKQDGGAHALEIADGYVVRIAAAKTDCPTVGDGSGCDFKLLRAPVGSSSWQDIRLPAGAVNTRVSLARSGSLVVVGTFANVAGGGDDAHAVLFASTDDGATWARRNDPCPIVDGHEVDTVDVTTAADGSITTVCQLRGGPATRFTMTSTDAGLTFVRPPANLPSSAGGSVLLGAGSAKSLFVQLARLDATSDGGAHWRPVAAPTQLGSIGFESSTVAHGIGVAAAATFGSPVIWRTADAGATWASYTFP